MIYYSAIVYLNGGKSKSWLLESRLLGHTEWTSLKLTPLLLFNHRDTSLRVRIVTNSRFILLGFAVVDKFPDVIFVVWLLVIIFESFQIQQNTHIKIVLLEEKFSTVDFLTILSVFVLLFPAFEKLHFESIFSFSGSII